MNSLLDWVFALDGLGFGAEGVRVGFARPLPGWAWLLLVLAAAAMAWWSYRRLIGVRWARAGLGVARGLVLVLLALLAAGPRLEQPNERVERDWSVVLVDRSASLTIEDVDAPDGARTSREAQLRQAWRSAFAALRDMDAQRNVLWLGFGAGAFELQRREDRDGLLEIELGQPEQRRTALGASLEQALGQVRGRRVSGVIVISDGRSVDEPPREVVERLQEEQIRVVTVPLGSPEPVADLALADVQAPSEAFVDDAVPVRVRVERLGEGGAIGGRVQLIDARTATVLDERPLEARAPEQTLTLRTTPGLAEDSAQWQVRIVPDRPDLVRENNARSLELALVDRPLRVAYFDGYPRWEYRYLKNLLLRERSIVSSALLLSSTRRYIQEGDQPLTTVPTSPEEWAPFDVIAIGDVQPAVFSEAQLRQIREHVATRGAGLIWIAGAGATPVAWAGTPLADLLPFDVRSVAPWDEPVTMFPAPLAASLGVLRIGEALDGGEGDFPPRLSDPATGWNQLRYAQRIDPESLKPAAEALALAAPLSAYSAQQTPDVAAPLVVTMRYGAGRVIYIATDELWRWRYGRGEALFERFWIPLVRLLGRESLARAGRGAIFDVSPRRTTIDQPVQFTVRLLDQGLIDRRAESVEVRLSSAGGAAQSVTLLPEQTASEGLFAFAGSWTMPEPEEYLAEVVSPWLAAEDLRERIRVFAPDDELRRPEADHAMLALLRERSIAPGTEPAPDLAPLSLPAERLAELPELIPVRDVRIEAPPTTRPLWDRPIVLIVLLLLLTAEWVGRKLLSLA